MADTRYYLDVDISDAAEMIRRLQALHTQREFEQIMYRAFSRTGAHVKAILRKELPKEYEAKPSWIGKQVGGARTQIQSGNVQCSIPIKGVRGGIGSGGMTSSKDGHFSATGGVHGWAALHTKYRVRTRIMKGAGSTLPEKMTHQGGYPPFRNIGSKLGGATFTRKTKERLPIARVVGIGVPQMPMNQSQDDVQEDIVETLKKRLEHEHQYMINKCR